MRIIVLVALIALLLTSCRGPKPRKQWNAETQTQQNP